MPAKCLTSPTKTRRGYGSPDPRPDKAGLTAIAQELLGTDDAEGVGLRVMRVLLSIVDTSEPPIIGFEQDEWRLVIEVDDATFWSWIDRVHNPLHFKDKEGVVEENPDEAALDLLGIPDPAWWFKQVASVHPEEAVEKAGNDSRLGFILAPPWWRDDECVDVLEESGYGRKHGQPVLPWLMWRKTAENAVPLLQQVS